MNHEEFDDLDRVLFALPLEEPPPGLRQAILRATVHAPAASAVPLMGFSETLVLGVVLAVAVWLAAATAVSGSFAGAVVRAATGLAATAADPAVAAWLGVGASLALCLSLLAVPGFTRARRT